MASNARGHRTEPGCESISLFAKVFSFASPERDIMCFVRNSQASLKLVCLIVSPSYMLKLIPCHGGTGLLGGNTL